MKNKLIFGLLFLFLSVCLYPSKFFAHNLEIEKLENKPFPEFHPPQILEEVLSEGTKVYFIRNQSLPIFELSVLFPFGSNSDLDHQRGLIRLLMQMITTGGSQSHSPDQIDEILESIAASISFDVYQEYSEIKIQSLQKDRDLVLDIFFELLSKPRFDKDRFDLTKKKYIASIKKRNENSMNIARREFKQQLYGEDSVWARNFREEDILAITEEHLKKLHSQIMSVDQMKIAISAKEDFEPLKKKIQTKLKLFPSSKNPLKISIPKVHFNPLPEVHVINKDGNQSAVIIGHLGGQRFQKDKFATILANFVLGGSTFGSRLGTRIRTTLGLAYSIYSQYGFETDYGIFAVMASTKTESTEKLISEVTRTIKEMQTTHPIKKEELEFAKQTLLNQIIFQYDSSFKIVNQERYYDFFGYPKGYLEIFQKEIKAVSLEEVNQAMKKNFYPDKLQIMAVGNVSDFDLSKIGKVKTLELDNN